MMKLHSPLIQVKVFVNSKPIQEYHKDQQTYIEGRKGSNFELSLKNLTGGRLLVHPTVDGLSAMTGKESARNDHSHGYVLSPHREMRVPGWRIDGESVAQFVFAGGGKSYAEQTGRPKNKGVIAAAVWEERAGERFCYEKPPIGVYNPHTFSRGVRDTPDPSRDTGTSKQYPLYYDFSFTNCSIQPDSASYSGEEKCSGRMEERLRRSRKSSSVNNLGTGFGKKAEHYVVTIKFVAQQDTPTAIAVIYYDDKDGLRNRGIKISKKPQSDGLPNPFPKDTGCAPPHGWRG